MLRATVSLCQAGIVAVDAMICHVQLCQVSEAREGSGCVDDVQVVTVQIELLKLIVCVKGVTVKCHNVVSPQVQ